MCARRRGAALAGVLLGVALSAVSTRARAGDDRIDLGRAIALAQEARPAIVRVQWRRKGAELDVVERQAIVVDRDGWLLMAGPRPSPDGTLAATLEDGRSMRAEVWASDPRTCLTLLHVPIYSLDPIPLAGGPARDEDSTGSSPTPRKDADATPSPRPERLPPGSPIVMVTAEGALARGSMRANFRHRRVPDPVTKESVEVTCLDEAAVFVVSTDLGAPWLNAKGEVVGLVVGAEVSRPDVDAPDDVRVRPEVTAAFAVPADVIREVLPLLRVHREVPRAQLGVLVRPLSDATRYHICPDCGGYEVLGVAPEGPAAHAHVEVRDIIRSVDGHPLPPDADLEDVLLPHRPGDAVHLGILRRGQPMDLEIVLGGS